MGERRIDLQGVFRSRLNDEVARSALFELHVKFHVPGSLEKPEALALRPGDDRVIPDDSTLGGADSAERVRFPVSEDVGADTQNEDGGECPCLCHDGVGEEPQKDHSGNDVPAFAPHVCRILGGSPGEERRRSGGICVQIILF